MRALPKTKELVEDVFTACISKIQDNNLKTRLTNSSNAIKTASEEFDNKANAGALYTIATSTNVANLVTTDEMVAVYRDRMAKKGAPGRPYYDKLISVPPYGRCPFCGHRIVSTLDHFLAKTEFPVFAVTPLNLVPSCMDCNKKKPTTPARSAKKQFLHPYYDNVEDDEWLKATLLEENPPSIQFSVNAPNGWPDMMKARVQYHFETLNLNVLYASNAATELSGIQTMLQRLYSRGGSIAVRDHLIDSAESWIEKNKNSWQGALYLCLAESDWFCDGGFNF